MMKIVLLFVLSMTFALTIAQTVGTAAEAFKHDKAKDYGVKNSVELRNMQFDDMEQRSKKDKNDSIGLTCPQSKLLFEKGIVLTKTDYANVAKYCVDIPAGTYEIDDLWHNYVKTKSGYTIIFVSTVALVCAIYYAVYSCRAPGNKARSRHDDFSASAEVDEVDGVNRVISDIIHKGQEFVSKHEDGASNTSDGSTYSYKKISPAELTHIVLDTFGALLEGVNDALWKQVSKGIKRGRRTPKEEAKLKRTERKVKKENTSFMGKCFFRNSSVNKSDTFGNILWTIVFFVCIVGVIFLSIYAMDPQLYGSWSALHYMDKDAFHFIRTVYHTTAKTVRSSIEKSREGFTAFNEDPYN